MRIALSVPIMGTDILIIIIMLLYCPLLQGVLRDSEDLKLFSGEFQEAYKERQVDPFADIY